MELVEEEEMRLESYLDESSRDDLMYVFDQVNWRADQRKRNNREAADYAALTRSKKVEYFNKHIVPEYVKIGKPKPYSEELFNFIQGLFR